MLKRNGMDRHLVKILRALRDEGVEHRVIGADALWPPAATFVPHSLWPAVDTVVLLGIRRSTSWKKARDGFFHSQRR